jgi:hypothetical protein
VEEARQHSAVITIGILALLGWIAFAVVVRALWKAGESGVLDVRGGPFSRVDDPITFWSGVAFCVFGSLFSLALASVTTYLLIANR